MIKLETLEKTPKTLFLLMSAFVLLLGYYDYITGWEMSFTIFYLIPILIAAWFIGGFAGGSIAVIGTLVGLVADIKSNIPYSYGYVAYWNAITRCVMFLVIVRLIVVIKNHLKGLKKNVEDKTSSLAQQIAECELAEQKLELINFSLENLTDAIYWVTVDGQFWEVNDTACAMLGYTREELLSRGVPDIDPNFSPEIWQTNLDKLRAERHLCVETVHLGNNGRKIPVEVTVNYFTYNGVEYNCAIVRDLSERKEAEAEKQSLMIQLNQSQKIESIGRLAGGIAHDFNNMLMPIYGYSELLKLHMQPGDPDVEKVNKIIQAADKAKILIQQLLGFGRKQILEMKIIDLNEVVSSIYEILQRTIRENIDIRLHLTQETSGIRADRHQIEQIIMNLIINAQDAIENKGVITIETAEVALDEEYARQHVAVKPGRYMMLVVTDTGSGMDQETISHVFEPFFTTKAEGKGTGLGLATVYGLVKQHGGNIWIYSEPGKGSAFKIYFPIVSDKPVAEQTVVSEHIWFNAANRTILLVEDNDQVRQVVYDLLDNQGFNVIMSDSARQALELANGKHIDLLITDVVMPDMNGPELHKKLSDSHPLLKVLFMSGYTNNSIADHGVLDEGINFIQKPFTNDNLLNKIQFVIRDLNTQ
ncbi:MAG: ATP-binding protein [Oryzomonas sp.]|uniref:ATP-binding protein n=1 Tax=Oryzomonas sp. TaxID=2855186 RepID=UPI002842A055|nr:ATP-binding protein [Oryzomonas sp.]MDR3578673.1 ATP-binding protein [Oryzomonas sp.]